MPLIQKIMPQDSKDEPQRHSSREGQIKFLTPGLFTSG
ncbi:MAG: hypothetical protein AVDCRST_MAG96-2706 [uncultured Segetibacter sp.]|uniref:Uncharacterized protein n=1 Tax=uncultured Segetibacter sp. TaxID=481133 RepID=A0A6J4T8T9_9BACT|nr:MAG: hypothetical protein AVDCRST_MAG96-2706 [uncultured Segetibacter sp.]